MIVEAEAMRRMVVEAIHSPPFSKATFTGPCRIARQSPWKRVVIEKVALRGGPCFQFSYFDAKKHIAKNLTQIDEPLDELLAAGFAAIHVSADEEIDIRLTKKGQIVLGRLKADPKTQPPSHNRIKDVLLPEGRSNRLLETMGILTREGAVRPTMRAKFTQINEFLKHLSHVIDELKFKSLGRDVRILDCGCGASYLTLAVHYYLNEIRGLPAQIVGVDVNDEVIRKSVAKADHLNTERLSFVRSKIGGVDMRPDIVLALHACDTATDDALALAIQSQATIVLSAPCCHHDLNRQLKGDGVMQPILRHGILRQRTADIVTDAFRALLLRMHGYRTDVVEFIAPEHTPRNLMIRGVKSTTENDARFLGEYRAMKEFWRVTPYLERLLGPALLVS